MTFFALLVLIAHHQAQMDPATIDSIVQSAVSTDSFEGTVLVADQGEIIYHKSFGFTDDQQEHPIVPHTHFGIASITKLFTAIVILQLVEEGQFALSDPLTSLLPEYDIPRSQKITPHHLLLHISGLPNEDDIIYRQAKTPQEFVSKTITQNGARFETFNYANIDYVLLGLIIEKFDERSWQASVQERILDNVELSNSGFLTSQDYPDNFAYSFSYRGSNLRQSDPLLFIENYYAAGSMYSTAEDLLKLDQAMYGDQLLSDQSKELMYTSYPEYNYSGYSVWTYQYPFATSNPRVMERRGGILGANAALVRMLDTNKTVIILSNNDQFNPDSFGDTSSLKEALIIAID